MELLNQYGSKWVDIAALRQRFGFEPDVAGGQDIGHIYVPPLGGISVIDPEHVAEGRAQELAAYDYKPWLVPQQGCSLVRLLVVAAILLLVYLAVRGAK